MSEYDLNDMTQRLLYQVTLSSGRILTRPDDFDDADQPAVAPDDYYRPVFSEDGRLLTVDADAARQTRAEDED